MSPAGTALRYVFPVPMVLQDGIAAYFQPSLRD